MTCRVTALVLVLGAAVAGCEGDVETPIYEISVFPRVAHSGWNPNASFRVMFATGASSPQWAVDDPTIATIAPSPQPRIAGANVKLLQFALVTTTRPGTTTVRMTSAGRLVTSQLVVKDYSDDQLRIGKERYDTASTDPARPPCASCHAQPDGVDHSPLKMAGFDDPTILGVIQEATYPANPKGGSTTSAFSPKGPLKFNAHKWNLSDPERDGILAYLRSLPLGHL
jgi:hypothetical protein